MPSLDELDTPDTLPNTAGPSNEKSSTQSDTSDGLPDFIKWELGISQPPFLPLFQSMEHQLLRSLLAASTSKTTDSDSTLANNTMTNPSTTEDDASFKGQRSKLGFYVPFNSQGHMGTGPQNCHLWDSNPQR